MAGRKKILLLTPPPEDWDAEAEDVGELSGWPGQKTVEVAGKAHYDYVQRRLGLSSEEEEEEEEDVDEQQKEKFASKKKTTKPLDTTDYYEVLGLGELRFQATAKQIKDAYRRLVLKHHPDKQRGTAEEIEDESFKALKQAYNVLSDPEKRRAFDSQDAFDDSIPSKSDITDEASFYEVFDRVFVRNSKWCVNGNVPRLGNASTPLKEVKRFYKFWNHFQSWRDFSGDAEYDLEEAESREEKRWMARQNKKQVEKKAREERARINKLVDLAYSMDPRILAEGAKAEAERKERIEKKKREREELAAEEAAEAERKKQEEVEKEKQIQEEKERVKRNLRKLKTKVRQICVELRGKGCKFMTDERIEKVVTGENVLKASVLEPRLDALHEALKTHVAKAEVDVKEVADLMKEEMKFLKETRDELDRRTEALMAGPKKKKEVESQTEWSQEELSLLAKGLRKFPAGTRNRWELVNQLVPHKSVEEIIAKTSEAKSSAAADQISGSDAFKMWQSKKKAPADATPDVISTRNNTLDRTLPWTAEEQVKLEQALMEFYPDDEDRWDKIAEFVDSRTRNDCVRRYRYLYAILANDKAS